MFWGIILIAVGFVVIKFRRQIHDFTGNIDFMEKYVGSTQNGLTLFGIILMALAVMYMTGGLDMFFQDNVSEYFEGEQ